MKNKDQIEDVVRQQEKVVYRVIHELEEAMKMVDLDDPDAGEADFQYNRIYDALVDLRSAVRELGKEKPRC